MASDEDLAELQRIIERVPMDATAFLPGGIRHEGRVVSYDSEEGRRLVEAMVGEETLSGSTSV